MHFSGSADSGFTVQLDAKAGVGGEGKGLLPMELMALSMAGCTAMDVISILRKKRQDVTDFEVRVDAPRAEEHPKVFTQATIEYVVTGHDIDEKAVRRAIELTAKDYCPAQAMLGQVMPIALRYKIFKKEAGEKRLVTKGEFIPQEA
jgi:putative redox protein